LTGRSAAHRWGQHKANARGNISAPIAQALRKHGCEAFDWEVVAEFEDLASAEKAERDLIVAIPAALNVFPGGRSGYRVPESVRARLSASALQQAPLSEEARQRISRSKLGRPLSAEVRAKLSLAHMGQRPSAETRLKLSASQLGNTKMLGKKRSPETRAKIAAALMGNTNRKKAA
jgi:hypothetical protein